tara:strand:- start:4375 stop:4614 length:240 start_codon:yes stop_codon:yes gene_type:complete
MLKLLKWIIIIILIGGAIYYLMDYNADKPEENDFIESSKEFSKDVINKAKKEGKELIEGAKEIVDSSKVINEAREELKN